MSNIQPRLPKSVIMNSPTRFPSSFRSFLDANATGAAAGPQDPAGAPCPSCSSTLGHRPECREDALEAYGRHLKSCSICRKPGALCKRGGRLWERVTR